MSRAERDLQNFDHPDSLDVDLFLADLDALVAGQGVSEPIYDFANHDRLPQRRAVAPAAIVLVDGILLLSLPEVLLRLDLSVFVDAEEDLRLDRRLARDVLERGRNEASVREQFRATVAPMHARFVQPSGSRADRVIDGNGDIEALAEALAAELMRRVAS